MSTATAVQQVSTALRSPAPRHLAQMATTQGLMLPRAQNVHRATSALQRSPRNVQQGTTLWDRPAPVHLALKVSKAARYFII